MYRCRSRCRSEQRRSQQSRWFDKSIVGVHRLLSPLYKKGVGDRCSHRERETHNDLFRVSSLFSFLLLKNLRQEEERKEGECAWRQTCRCLLSDGEREGGTEKAWREGIQRDLIHSCCGFLCFSLCLFLFFDLSLNSLSSRRRKDRSQVDLSSRCLSS